MPSKKKETKKQRRERVLTELRSLSDIDPERSHDEADQLLLQLIDDPEITAAFAAIEKWYA